MNILMKVRKISYIKQYNFLSFILLFIFFITNNYYNISESVENGFMDINSYLKIYSIITKSELKDTIAYYHLERWPVHFVIRYINDKIGVLNLYYSYLLISIIVLLHITKLIDKTRQASFSA